jgi:hypothetical protein
MKTTASWIEIEIEIVLEFFVIANAYPNAFTGASDSAIRVKMKITRMKSEKLKPRYVAKKEEKARIPPEAATITHPLQKYDLRMSAWLD